MPQPPNFVPKTWYRDGYVVSSNASLIDIDALSDACASDLMWWTRATSKDVIRQFVDNSLCFGLYVLPASTSEIAGKSGPQMVGMSRVVTDWVTYGYLLDVYVLPEHQGQGLGKWMMQCIRETLDGWPDLRRFMLIVEDDNAVRMYEKTLGAELWNAGPAGKLRVMNVSGEAVQPTPDH